MKLIFAAFWILLGGGILYWVHTYGDTHWMVNQGGLRFTYSQFAAIVAFVLALYNLVGWWNYRMARARARAEATIEQKKYARGRRKQPGEGTNPDFDFKNPPTNPA